MMLHNKGRGYVVSGPTHLSFAFMLYAITCVIYFIDPKVGLIFLMGALFPDIDHPKSMIGRWFFFLKLTHRKETHSLPVIFGLMILGMFALFVKDPSYFFNYWIFVLAFTAGQISHVVLDLYNLFGVYLFWPFSSKRISFRDKAKDGKKSWVLNRMGRRKYEKLIDGILLLVFTLITVLVAVIFFADALFL
jgi:membrane-bound metal-dependent hydrolase YbcI (DUF457 family)